MSCYKEIVKLLEANAGAKRMAEVFDDFVEMSALTFRNAVDSWGYDEREAQYLRTAGRYDREELNRFAHALALVVTEMDEEPCDVLGRLYMELELGNGRLGQFFTPYDVARLVAGMQIDGIAECVRSHGFAELYEPACGAAAFIVAVSQEMRTAGLNPQTQLHVTAEDIAPQAVHMAYIHLSLLHVPAVVHRRNTLTLETFDTWRTPAHILGGWGWKFRHAAALQKTQELLDSAAPHSGTPPFTTAFRRTDPRDDNPDLARGEQWPLRDPGAQVGDVLVPLGTGLYRYDLGEKEALPDQRSRRASSGDNQAVQL